MVNDFAGGSHGRLEPVTQKLHLRVNLVEMPGQAGAERDALFEFLEGVFAGASQAAVEDQQQAPFLFPREFADFDLLGLRGGFPINVARRVALLVIADGVEVVAAPPV